MTKMTTRMVTLTMMGVIPMIRMTRMERKVIRIRVRKMRMRMIRIRRGRVEKCVGETRMEIKVILIMMMEI